MADPESDIQASVINILRGGDKEFILILKQELLSVAIEFHLDVQMQCYNSCI